MISMSEAREIAIEEAVSLAEVERYGDWIISCLHCELKSMKRFDIYEAKVEIRKKKRMFRKYDPIMWEGLIQVNCEDGEVVGLKKSGWKAEV